jgi:signal transduction histidine kinase
MAWTSSAYPESGAARAQARRPAMAKAARVLAKAESFFVDQRLQTAGAAHLGVLTATVLNPTAHPLPLLLVVTGLLLVVLSLSHSAAKTRQSNDIELAAPAQPAADRGVMARQLVLEGQSQRLVEIADAATRARREAELRGRVWAELTARISHELRTPLNAVIGFSDIMEAELFGPVGHDRYKEYSRHIRESGQDLLKSTEDTLALTACLGTPQSPCATVALDLDVMIADAWSFFGAAPQGRSITLDMHVAPGLDVLCERRPLRQILVNLLTEGLARAPAHGIIRIAARDCHDLVELELEVIEAKTRPQLNEAPLAICIARVLLEMQGSGLTESVDPARTWRATTVLERATQTNLFANA